jgi:hypothetical protein
MRRLADLVLFSDGLRGVFIDMYLLQCSVRREEQRGGEAVGARLTTQTELIQCRSFVTVWRSPKNTWPRCEPQFAHMASRAEPSARPWTWQSSPDQKPEATFSGSYAGGEGGEGGEGHMWNKRPNQSQETWKWRDKGGACRRGRQSSPFWGTTCSIGLYQELQYHPA